MPEENEKKIDSEATAEAVVEETKIEKSAEIDEDSDFADEAAPVEVPADPIPEEKEKDPEDDIELHVDNSDAENIKPEVVADDQPSKKSKDKEIAYVYDDDNLSAIEAARKSFHAYYKKLNTIKWIVTAGCLVIMILGWLIPSLIKGLNSQVTMYIALGVAILAIIGIGVYSFLFRKWTDEKMKVYFNDYYEHSNKYVYGDKLTITSGNVNAKLDEDIFRDSGAFKDITKVSSRACYQFEYKDHKGVVADAAAQKTGERALQTLYIGRFMKFDGKYGDVDTLIYLKGNDRALPPNSLKGRGKPIEDTKTMVAFGGKGSKSLLNNKVKSILNEFHTNKTFVDMTILLNANGAYFFLGYEDDLMVLPLDKPYNPAPTIQEKGDIEKVLALVDALDSRHEH